MGNNDPIGLRNASQQYPVIAADDRAFSPHRVLSARRNCARALRSVRQSEDVPGMKMLLPAGPCSRMCPRLVRATVHLGNSARSRRASLSPRPPNRATFRTDGILGLG